MFQIYPHVRGAARNHEDNLQAIIARTARRDGVPQVLHELHGTRYIELYCCQQIVQKCRSGSVFATTQGGSMPWFVGIAAMQSEVGTQWPEHVIDAERIVFIRVEQDRRMNEPIALVYLVKGVKGAEESVITISGEQYRRCLKPLLLNPL
jgi:hypothetical protein